MASVVILKERMRQHPRWWRVDAAGGLVMFFNTSLIEIYRLTDYTWG